MWNRPNTNQNNANLPKFTPIKYEVQNTGMIIKTTYVVHKWTFKIYQYSHEVTLEQGTLGKRIVKIDGQLSIIYYSKLNKKVLIQS